MIEKRTNLVVLPDGSAPVVCRICWVSGRVQGVFYRGSARRRARELGITGHACNLADGRVEVLVCGESAQVDAFIDWLWIGPSAASVTGVEIAECEPAERPSAFTVA